MTSLEQLPDPVLSTIFAYLDPKTRLRMERVCTRFQLVAHGSWSHMEVMDFEKLFPMPQSPTDSLALKPLMIRCGRHLKELVANTCFQFPVLELRYIGQCCTMLKTIRLRWPVFICSENTSSLGDAHHAAPCGISQHHLAPVYEFFASFKQLEELSLVYPYADFPILIEVDFLSQFPNLKRLQLCEVDLKSDTFPFICQQLSDSLECLVLLDSFPNLDEEAFVNGVSRLVNLKALTLRHLRLGSDSGYLTDSAIARAVEPLLQLRFLFLARVDRLAQLALTVVASLQHLEFLFLQNCEARAHLHALVTRPATLTHELHVFVRDRENSPLNHMELDLRPQYITLCYLDEFRDFVKLIRAPNFWLFANFWNLRMLLDGIKYNPKRGGGSMANEEAGT